MWVQSAGGRCLQCRGGRATDRCAERYALGGGELGDRRGGPEVVAVAEPLSPVGEVAEVFHGEGHCFGVVCDYLDNRYGSRPAIMVPQRGRGSKAGDG